MGLPIKETVFNAPSALGEDFYCSAVHRGPLCSRKKALQSSGGMAEKLVGKLLFFYHSKISLAYLSPLSMIDGKVHSKNIEAALTHIKHYEVSNSPGVHVSKA